VHSAAKLQKNTQHQAHPPVGGDSPFGEHKADIRHGGHTKIKNNDQLNLSLCPLWFLGVFVLKIFCQKNKDLTCNIIGHGEPSAWRGTIALKHNDFNTRNFHF
jgi:hypothetical protein